jgi:hypothetical protein
MVGWLDGGMDEISKSRLLILILLTLALYQTATHYLSRESRLQIRVMRDLKGTKGDRIKIKGALQTIQDPNVHKIIPVLYLV